MTREELLQRKVDLLEEKFNLNMRLSIKPLDNPLRLRLVHREVARIETVLNEDRLDIRKLADQKTSILGQTSSDTKDKG
jgi:large subunit ribosomal protein L29